MAELFYLPEKLRAGFITAVALAGMSRQLHIQRTDKIIPVELCLLVKCLMGIIIRAGHRHGYPFQSYKWIQHTGPAEKRLLPGKTLRYLAVIVMEYLLPVIFVALHDDAVGIHG